MAKNFSKALEFAWLPENDGQPFHHDMHDTGGDTSWGVTQGCWVNAVRRGYVRGTLGNATKSQLATVLYVDTWQPVHGEALPPGVDTLVFDMGMLAGPGTAAKLLQRIVGVDADGAIGPVTLSAVAEHDVHDLIGKLVRADDTYVENLSTFRWFGRGWLRRIGEAGAFAERLAAA